ncbi:hypothetical protein F5Y19DRAFT_449206 [Xylariaceae sp. FL1651]|nr:hypothetical protein F5Y19DRAFT_449206 [Xylariaceae sp. FL1651]
MAFLVFWVAFCIKLFVTIHDPGSYLNSLLITNPGYHSDCRLDSWANASQPRKHQHPHRHNHIRNYNIFSIKEWETPPKAADGASKG